MGLLDDAIREHLDLKRRRGADPTEVEREEREVLGPVRRRGEEEPEPQLAYEEDLEHEPLPQDAGVWDNEPVEVEAAPLPPAPAFDHEEPVARPPEVYEPAPFAPEPEPEAEPEPEPEPRFYRDEAAHDPPAGGSTVEYSVEDAIAEEDRPHPAGAEEEDVLEETPDFLQDTPDHDRLWFEQRPPRDFDFDG
jgi:hypothetical protein